MQKSCVTENGVNSNAMLARAGEERPICAAMRMKKW